jgi:hypothetical protein
MEPTEAGPSALAPVPADDTIAALATRGFVGRPGRTIGTATLAGLLAMGVSFAVTPSPFVAMAALFVGILAVFGFRSGDVAFRLTADGLHRTFAAFAGLRRREHFFPFADMRFYRRERDWSRYRQEEVERLVVALRRPPFRIVIHDMMGRSAFEVFAGRFEEIAAAAGIVRRPGFYGTVWAKLLLVVFTIAAGGLIVLLALGTLSPTNTFRLFVVILPGVGYMGWRILARPRRGVDESRGVTGGGG